MRNSLKPTLLAAVGLFVLAGCSAPAEPEITELDVDAIAAETSDFQRGILEDGVVLPEEYERAVLAQRECVTAAGASAGEIESRGNNELSFDWEIEAPSQEELDSITSEADSCVEEYVDAVGSVWAYQQLLTPEERSERRPEVVACLQTAGIELADDADFEEIVESISADESTIETAQDCMTEYIDYFSVAPDPESHDDHDHDH